MLTHDSPMPFGMYKGKKMQDVPARYLDWFAGEYDPDNASTDAIRVFDYIERNRSVINQELENR